ncbi:MAG: hypothetical protein OXU61_04335 [Gammaproteobacteria bacterium]|nr:hypothetical protein [Gammaproteobacteria bacterium]
MSQGVLGLSFVKNERNAAAPAARVQSPILIQRHRGRNSKKICRARPNPLGRQDRSFSRRMCRRRPGRRDRGILWAV